MNKLHFRIAALACGLLLAAACKNSSGGTGFPAIPPTPPPGSTLPPDAGGPGGGTSGAGTVIDCVTPFYDALTPFRNPLELQVIDPSSSGTGDYPGLAALATAQFPEVGQVLLALWNNGIVMFDSIGRPLARPLTFDGDCGVTAVQFLWPPGFGDNIAPLDMIEHRSSFSTNSYLVAYNSGAIGIWGFERGYIGGSRAGEGPPDDYFFECDLADDGSGNPVGARDFWISGDNEAYCSSTAERLCGATNASLQLFNMGGGPRNLGLEYDAFGNLWHRSLGTGQWPDGEDDFQCEQPGDSNAGNGGRNTTLPLLVVWERALQRAQASPQALNDACPYETTADGFPGGEGGIAGNPGQCNVHVFHSPIGPVNQGGGSGAWGIATNFPLSAVSDFDFTSDNRMVFTNGEQHYVGWTNQIPDHFNNHPFGQPTGPYIPPLPVQQVFQTGSFGSNSGPINTHFNTPWGVAVDRGHFDCAGGTKDCVYITDFGNARITVFDDDGNFERTFGPAVSPQVSLFGPMDVYFDEFCRIFVLDRHLRADFSTSSDMKIMFRENCPVPTPGSASVTVKDGTNGAPIEGARVVLGLFAASITGITDAQGQVDFPTIPPGQRFVTVSADGYVGSTHEFFVSSGETVTIEDAPASGSVSIFPIGQAQTGGVTGAVRDAVSGTVIPGAVVSVRGTGQLGLTGLNGQFSIQGIVAGAQTLDVSAAGYFSNSKGVTIVAGLSIDVGDILLTPLPPT